MILGTTKNVQPDSKNRQSPEHRRMLFEESGIDPGVAAERGYYTARSRAEIPEAFGIYQRRLGLVVPMYSPDGVTRGWQLRPDKPRKKGLKYETPDGVSPVADVHPRMLAEARHGTGPLLITEGCKTGDAATSRGICTVVLAGVWMWCVPGVRPYRLRPCFDHIRLEGRKVYVAFDSDCASKPEVQQAQAALVAALEAHGADVRVIYLPDAQNGAKQGIDDYLVAGGTVREMLALARRYDHADAVRIRLSRDAMLREAVEDLERRLWAEEWKGRGGHSDRDVAIKLIEAATRSGKVHPDGLRVRVSWGELEVGAKVSRRTLAKALARLEERGFLYRDNASRKADRSGAFVLRANVNQVGEQAKQAAPGLRGHNPGGLPLRAPFEGPRLRWTRPAFTPRRGTVRGTRRVRESKPQEPRDRIERLGKIRGAVVDVLQASGGALTLAQLCEILHRSRARDLRRRVLPMLEEARIIEVASDLVSLTADWSERLEDARRIGGEIEADELAEQRRKDKSRAYRVRDKVEPTPHWANTGADGRVEDLRPADEPRNTGAREGPVSPLAAAIRSYLDRNPRDACERPSWIANTLWALELTEGKPTPTEVGSAIEELGGDPYLRLLLDAARGAA
jgi:hypothetical protein